MATCQLCLWSCKLLHCGVCAVILCERKALACLSLTLSPTCSAVESGCLLSTVVFHHVHSPFWHAYQYSICVCVCVCV